MRYLIRCAPLLAVPPGGYALLCWFTDTWREVPPSQHVMCMVLGVIGAAILAIITAPPEENNDA